MAVPEVQQDSKVVQLFKILARLLDVKENARVTQNKTSTHVDPLSKEKGRQMETRPSFKAVHTKSTKKKKKDNYCFQRRHSWESERIKYERREEKLFKE